MRTTWGLTTRRVAFTSRRTCSRSCAGIPPPALYGATVPKSASKAVKAGAAKGEAKAFVNENAYRHLIRPLITEKATHLGAENKYVFVVEPSINKIMVKKAIEAVYGVKATKVNLINQDGKRVIRGRIKGQRKDWKKAIVTLAKGDTIQVYAGV